MKSKKNQPTYDTQTTRTLLDLETAQDVYNLTRPGALLYGARVRAGSFDPYRVQHARRVLIRTRLARKLGRVSPRYVEREHSRRCPTCRGVAVAWEGQVLCEHGHKSEDTQNEDTKEVSHV